MKRYCVLVLGMYEQPSPTNKDGVGFVTWRHLEAESEAHAREAALRLVADDPRTGQPLDGASRSPASLSVDEIRELEDDEEMEDGPKGFIHFGAGAQQGVPADATRPAGSWFPRFARRR